MGWSRTECAGKTAPCLGYPVAFILWYRINQSRSHGSLLLNENKGITVLHYLQTEKYVCLKPKKPAYRRDFPEYSTLAPNGFFWDSQHKCIHFSGSTAHPMLCPLDSPTQSYFRSNIILNFEQATYFSIVF